MKTNAFAAQSPAAPLAQISIERREPGPKDVALDILYCGVCHSDLHTARGEWAGTKYPCVPGHEIVGRVTAVGRDVKRMAPGALVGVGCMVDSCRQCDPCRRGLEQYCSSDHGCLMTYNGYINGGDVNTFGGYSSHIVVDEHFALAITHPEKDLAGVAPLLCAGVTTWSPLKHWGAGPGKVVGVVGIGGLGHMAVKLAHAFGARVVAFTRSASKRDSLIALGADEVVVSTRPGEMSAKTGRLDLILNTLAVPHDLDAYLTLLRLDGVMVLLGVPATEHPSPSAGNLILKRRSLVGSVIGGIPETQEMLDFCASHGITSDVEVIAMNQINTAYDRLLKSDVKYRFSIDMATLK